MHSLLAWISQWDMLQNTEYHQHFILSSFRMKKLNADANLLLKQTNVADLLSQTNMEFTFVHCSFFDNMLNFVEQ